MREANDILNEILNNRGIRSEEDIFEFLSDKPQRTYDPFLLLNMKAGVDLLLSAIDTGTRICIYGDYDADGVTSICILSSIICKLTDNFRYYIPSRVDEGYGLNNKAISALKDDGVGLIITVDCGSVSYEEVEFAKRLGMKVIVTDHHNIDDVAADCILINPKQKQCPYPFKELAGCGVAFKLAQALQRQTGLSRSLLNDVLDLVAIGTVGDIVSLTDENRVLVKYGLKRINTGQRQALKRLTEGISLTDISSENIAFGIAPHINAAGRMASAYEAAELFMTEDEKKIYEQVQKLVCYNNERKVKQQEAYSRCEDMIQGDENFIILHMPEIHEGIAGIVAGKIKESFRRPVIIVTPVTGNCLKGTGRSIINVDIYKLLRKHSGLFERFGGHKSACGFLMKAENLPELRSAADREMKGLLEKNPDLFIHDIEWEISLYPEEINVTLAKELEKLEPFGQGNQKPLFIMKKILTEQVKFMGQDLSHVKFMAVSESGARADCILFKRAQEKKDIICNSQYTDIIGTVNLKKWNGRESAQFIVEEIMPWK